MKKLIEINDKDVEPLKVKAVKSGVSFTKYITQVLTEKAKDK